MAYRDDSPMTDGLRGLFYPGQTRDEDDVEYIDRDSERVHFSNGDSMSIDEFTDSWVDAQG